jgi:hypothetical protein
MDVESVSKRQLGEVLARQEKVEAEILNLKLETDKSLSSTTEAEFGKKVRSHLQLVEFTSFGFLAAELPDLSKFCIDLPDRDASEKDYQSYLCSQLQECKFGSPYIYIGL